MKETKKPVGIRKRLPRISIADHPAERRGLTARVGEETVKVKLMLLGGQLSLWGCRVRRANLPYPPEPHKGTCQL